MIQLSDKASKLITGNRSGFLTAVQGVASFLNIKPEWLLVCMYMESKFNPEAVNPITGATGLIQFMPATAKEMGVSTDYIKRKTNVQQMAFVQDYLKKYKGKMKSLVDVYLAIFYPLAITKNDSFVMGSQISEKWALKIAQQNGIYDKNKDGKITKAEIRSYIENLYFTLYPEQKKKLFRRYLKVRRK